MSIHLPRMEDGAVLHPSRLSITQNLYPISTATMDLPEGEPTVPLHGMVELFGPHGSVGIFRVASVQKTIGNGQSISLEHGIVTLEGDITPKESKLSGNMETILKTILGYQSDPVWTVGTVEDKETHSVDADQQMLLQALIDAGKSAPGYAFFFDQSVKPWKVHFLALSEKPECECRITRNMLSGSIQTDDSNLVTRVYHPLLPGGYLDGPTADKWGIMAEPLDAPDDAEPGAVKTYAERYLDDHKDPAVSITMDAVQLSTMTGEPMDALTNGKMCRIALPEYGLTTCDRIITTHCNDALTRPEIVTLTLSTQRNTTGSVLASMASEVKRTSGGVGGLAKQAKLQEMALIEAEKLIALNAQNIVANAEAIILRATKEEVTEIGEGVDGLLYRMEQAEMTLEGSTAEIKTVSQKVDDNGVAINKAILRISAADNRITALAGEIELAGYVTINDRATIIGMLDAADIVCGSLNAGSGEIIGGSGDFINLYSESAGFDDLNIGGNPAATQKWVNEESRAVRAVKDVSASGNTLSITLYDGTTVNFKKASVANLIQTWSGGRLTITTNTTGLTLSGDTTATVNTSPQNMKWGGTDERIATFDVTSDKGTIVGGMKLDAKRAYNVGWNACRSACTAASNVYTISETAGTTLYKQITVSGQTYYTGVGSDWVRVTSKTGLYTRPSKKDTDFV